jgi:hypothetical protein
MPEALSSNPSITKNKIKPETETKFLKVRSICEKSTGFNYNQNEDFYLTKKKLLIDKVK